MKIMRILKTQLLLVGVVLIAPFLPGTSLFAAPKDSVNLRQGGCTPVPVIPGQVIVGEITSQDCKSPSEPVFFTGDLYSFDAIAGQRADILVTENDFATALVLYSPTGGELDKDTGDGGTGKGWISYTIRSSGKYSFEIRGNSLSKETGRYAIRFNLGCEPVPLQSGQVITGALSIEDCQSPAPRTLDFDIFVSFSDLFSFSATAGQQLDFLLSEAGFDGLLILYSPSGIAILKEGGGVEQPWMRTTLTSTGTYFIEIRSDNGREFGNYLARINIGCPSTAFNPGSTSTGSLTSSDCMSNNRSYCFADRYTFAGVAGRQVEIAVQESTFDSYLILYSPLGSPLVEDNNSGGNNRALIKTTLATTGNYTFEVTSANRLNQGNYLVRFSGEPDFSITLSQPQISTSRGGKGTITVNVVRTGGFTGNIVVSPPSTKPLKIKLTPSTPQPAPQTSISFSFKVKNTAPSGTQQLVFSASDGSGKLRTATLNFTIQ